MTVFDIYSDNGRLLLITPCAAYAHRALSRTRLFKWTCRTVTAQSADAARPTPPAADDDLESSPSASPARR